MQDFFTETRMTQQDTARQIPKILTMILLIPKLKHNCYSIGFGSLTWATSNVSRDCDLGDDVMQSRLFCVPPTRRNYNIIVCISVFLTSVYAVKLTWLWPDSDSDFAQVRVRVSVRVPDPSQFNFPVFCQISWKFSNFGPKFRKNLKIFALDLH